MKCQGWGPAITAFYKTYSKILFCNLTFYNHYIGLGARERERVCVLLYVYINACTLMELVYNHVLPRWLHIRCNYMYLLRELWKH